MTGKLIEALDRALRYWQEYSDASGPRQMTGHCIESSTDTEAALLRSYRELLASARERET